jgi:hypothetical protein
MEVDLFGLKFGKPEYGMKAVVSKELTYKIPFDVMIRAFDMKGKIVDVRILRDSIEVKTKCEEDEDVE